MKFLLKIIFILISHKTLFANDIIEIDDSEVYHNIAEMGLHVRTLLDANNQAGNIPSKITEEQIFEHSLDIQDQLKKLNIQGIRDILMSIEYQVIEKNHQPKKTEKDYYILDRNASHVREQKPFTQESSYFYTLYPTFIFILDTHFKCFTYDIAFNTIDKCDDEQTKAVMDDRFLSRPDMYVKAHFLNQAISDLPNQWDDYINCINQKVLEYQLRSDNEYERVMIGGIVSTLLFSSVAGVAYIVAEKVSSVSIMFGGMSLVSLGVTMHSSLEKFGEVTRFIKKAINSTPQCKNPEEVLNN